MRPDKRQRGRCVEDGAEASPALLRPSVGEWHTGGIGCSDPDCLWQPKRHGDCCLQDDYDPRLLAVLLLAALLQLCRPDTTSTD